jgi:cell division transport system permease protein
MSPRGFLYLAREGIYSARRHPALTIAAILSISASLLVLAITLLITSNIERSARSLDNRRVIDVYLTERISATNRAAIESALRGTAGVAEVRYISKDDALAAFRADVGRYDLVEALGYNPLPASFRLELAPGAATAARMREIADDVSALQGVEDVRFGGEWIQRLDTALLTLRLAEIVTAILVGLAVAFAVNSTIRLTVLARREMIEIMSAVGATNTYIRMPFLVEGVAQALVAAFGTLLVLKIVIVNFSARFLNAQVHFLDGQEIAGFLAFAGFLGLLGALWSLGDVLRRSA